MRILFDGRYLGIKQGGIRRETYSLIKNLAQKVEFVTYLSRKQENDTKLQACRSLFSRSESNLFTLLSKQPMKVKGYTTVILPSPSNLQISSDDKAINIVRLHDIFPLTNPSWFHKYQASLFSINMSNLVKSNSIFICDSIYTQKSLNNYFKLSLPSYVVPCYVLKEKKSRCENCEGCLFTKIPNRYYLSVGTIEPRKDYSFLHRAIVNIKDWDIKFVIVGQIGWKIDATFNNFVSNRKVKHLSKVCDGSLEDMYKSAIAFISTSIEEGFNLPAMEARRTGLPLILRKNNVHLEYHSNIATFFSTEKELASIIENELFQKLSSNEIPPECNNIATLPEVIARFIQY